MSAPPPDSPNLPPAVPGAPDVATFPPGTDRYRLIAEQTEQITYDHRGPALPLGWSGAVFGLLGYPFAEFQSAGFAEWRALIHPDDRESARAHLDLALQRGGRFDFIYRVRHREGHYLHLRDCGVVLPTTPGRAPRIVGSLTDVSAEHLKDEALRTLHEGCAGAVGVQFFERFVLEIARVLGAVRVFSGQLDEQHPEMVFPIALCHRETLIPAAPFAYADALSRAVVENGGYLAVDDAPAVFPGMAAFEEWGVRSYAAAALESEDGRVTGVISALFSAPPRHPEVVAMILKTFAVRGAAEIKRMRMEATLRASEAQLSEVFDHTNDIIFLLNVTTEGRFIYERLNRRCEELGSLTNAKARGKAVDELFSPAIAARFIATNRRCVAARTPLTSEETHFLKDRTVTLQTTLVPIMDADGVVRRLAGFSHDVTEIRRHQALLEQTEQAARIGSWEYDCQTHGIFWSAETYLIYGVSPATFIPTIETAHAPIQEVDRARLVEAMNHSIATGEGYDLTVRFTPVGGPPVHLRAIARTKMKLGAVVALYGSLQDVTAQVESAEAIRLLNAELEHRVADRTAQLAAANAELEAFSYSVSHDLRSPLRAIDGFSRALEEDFEDKLDETSRDYLRRIRGGSQRMGLLIDDLLRLSKATRVELNRRPVNLAAFAHLIATDLRERYPTHPVNFVCPSVIDAHADANLLRIVLENLLENAWKYSRDQPAPRIEFGVQASAPPEPVVYFVRDNGAGFDLRHAGKLFGAFQRLHAASEFEGTGIGLATVRRIVNRHGGRVWAEATPGQGASFYFTLSELRSLN